ncbi:MAG: UDP-3-O-(3-hydroxymyristoyl)glucosamine N-acyltransferase [Cyclobacteriaceae bacterium]
MELKLAEIATLLNGQVYGDENIKVTRIESLEHASSGSLSFLSNPKYEKYIYSTQASAIIVSHDFIEKEKVSKAIIKVKDAYSSLTTLLDYYANLKIKRKNGIEQPCHIDASATLGSNSYVGAFSYIGENVIIGDNVKIYPQTYIGDNTRIGNNCILYAGVKIYSDTLIGNYCTIQSGAVLGSDGFGFAPQADGSFKSIPQIGNVILEDHVDVGANTTIDCGTFESTIIKKGVKIDNLIQLAHNTEIGENTVIAAQAGIAGSTKVGKNCIIGGQAGIVGHVFIADNTKIQAQSGVTKNSKEGQALHGSPALNYQNYVRSYTIFKRLPEVLKQIELLEEKILNLQQGKKDS